ncbi:MAG: TetR/AcrR family transcriptional regulator [Balneolaceae bacterium]
MGTSLSDLTQATGLTKGAIYGNFKNKEELAVEAFKYNVREILSHISSGINKASRSIDKLFAITNFYRGYYDYTKFSGGCPILNVGSDTKHVNPTLFRMVKRTARKLEESITSILLEGVQNNEFKSDLDISKSARNIYSMIEGSVFMAVTHDDRTYLINMMDQIEEIIREKFIK